MTKRVLYLLLLLLSYASCSPAHPVLNEDTEDMGSVDLIIKRVVEDRLVLSAEDEAGSDESLGKLLSVMNDEGGWDDIDYSSHESAAWEPHYHLDRTTVLAIGYVNDKSQYYSSDYVVTSILKALRYWVDVKATCTNWWWRVIGEPQRLGMLLVLLKAGKVKIDKELEAGLLARMPDTDSYGYSGANRSDVGVALLYKALYTADCEKLAGAMESIFSAIEYGDDYSFQKDGSYVETGPQLYIGGYAEVLLSNILRYAVFAKGTEYGLSEERMEIISNYVRGVYASAIRGHVMAFNCHGRSVSRENQLDKTTSVEWIEKLKGIDTENEEAYSEMMERLNGLKSSSNGIKDNACHYYIGDFTTQTTSGYNITLRTLSTRTRRDELENGENLKGYFVCDGSTNIVRSGEEYFNIMPLWDWSYIPGTTAPDITEIPQTYFMQMGVSEFCGGATDSNSAVVVLDYFDSYKGINTGGKKGYFLFNDMMVCLGTNLLSDKPFHTTVNQCWATSGNTTFSKRGEQETIVNIVETEQLFNGSLDWLIYDNIGYFFPGEQTVKLKSGSREGCWYDINQGFGSKEIVKGNVFQLSLEHCNDNTYQYVVSPNATAKDMQDLASGYLIEIISNTNELQAVYHKRDNRCGMIFYKSGQVDFGKARIVVDHPCVMLVDVMDGNNYDVYVTDPTQKLSSLKVAIESAGQKYEQTVYFSDEHKGKTEHVIFSFPSSVASQIGIMNDNAHRFYNLTGISLKDPLKSKGPYIKVFEKRVEKVFNMKR